MVKTPQYAGEGKTKMITHLGKVHLCGRDYDDYYERRQRTPGLQAGTPSQIRSNPVKPVLALVK